MPILLTEKIGPLTVKANNKKAFFLIEDCAFILSVTKSEIMNFH